MDSTQVTLVSTNTTLNCHRFSKISKEASNKLRSTTTTTIIIRATTCHSKTIRQVTTTKVDTIVITTKEATSHITTRIIILIIRLTTRLKTKTHSKTGKLHPIAIWPKGMT